MVGALNFRYSRRRLKIIAVWAMVPVVLVNGWFGAGCVCADGHFEPFCRAGCSLCHDSAASDVTGACCQHACCERANSDRGERAGSQETADCRAPGDSHQRDANGKGCCTPVVRSPVLATQVAAPGAHGRDVLALVPLSLDLAGADVIEVAIRRRDTDLRPPPDDLVIVLRRLVI